ncbi:hypothetical protein LIER_00829 [Lithospermum erythrorhizon]|uniref:Uncharacterized protein n=1 Tax=Lithospermum erythrorhizon TaxID=34254 RepID=A0AAV3NJX4_LITER
MYLNCLTCQTTRTDSDEDIIQSLNNDHTSHTKPTTVHVWTTTLKGVGQEIWPRDLLSNQQVVPLKPARATLAAICRRLMDTPGFTIAALWKVNHAHQDW